RNPLGVFTRRRPARLVSAGRRVVAAVAAAPGRFLVPTPSGFLVSAPSGFVVPTPGRFLVSTPVGVAGRFGLAVDVSGGPAGPVPIAVGVSGRLVVPAAAVWRGTAVLLGRATAVLLGGAAVLLGGVAAVSGSWRGWGWRCGVRVGVIIDRRPALQ